MKALEKRKEKPPDNAHPEDLYAARVREATQDFSGGREAAASLASASSSSGGTETIAEKAARVKRQMLERRGKVEEQEVSTVDKTLSWFSGEVPAAISTAKEEKVPLIVVAIQDDESGLNKQLDLAAKFVAKSGSICLLLQKGSQKLEQFSSIYSIEEFPSIFFINSLNGAKLDRLSGSGINARAILEALNEAKKQMSSTVPASVRSGADSVMSPRGARVEEAQKALKESAATPEPNQAASSAASSASNLEDRVLRAKRLLAERQAQKDKEEQEVEKSKEKERRVLGQQMAELKRKQEDEAIKATAAERHKVKEDAQKDLKESAGTPEPNQAASAAASSASSLEDRVLKAKRLLAERQAQKDKEEQEVEKSKEKERRVLGQQMAELKRKQEDEAIKAAAAERRKDKEEEKKAREKIKRQIEQDRLERAEKFSAEKEAARKAKEEKERAALAAAAKRAEEEIAARSSKARIQFRLPDGRSQTKQFDPDEPLSVIYDFVSKGEEIQVPFAAFSLSTTFPSRKLDDEDKRMSLRRLGLVPSGTVLILPKSGGGGTVGLGGVMDIVWLLLTPITALWAIISGFLFPPPRNNGNAPSSATGARPRGARPDGSNPRRRGQDGNMARLQDYTDDDDETNTYNGNSTQQMWCLNFSFFHHFPIILLCCVNDNDKFGLIKWRYTLPAAPLGFSWPW